jgi:hypothetical protein
MQKVIRFLEAGIEWIALAIALLYLGWAVFAYLINDPVSVSLGGQQVNPATIDNYIETHAALHLTEIMDPNNVQVPSFTVEPFGDDFNRRLALDNEKPPELAAGDFAYQPFEPTGPSGQNAKMLIPVQILPTLPAARPVLIAAALDTLAPPAAPGTPPAAPGTPPAVPGAAPAANPAVPGKDVRLVVAAFTISWDDLYKQWNNSFGPPAAGQQPRLSPADFQILQISAFRSEKVGNEWVDDHNPIKILNGADLPPYPPAGNPILENAYLQALNKSLSTIVAPAIPTIIAGAVWKDPLQYLPGASNQPGVPAPPDQSGATLPPESGRLRTVNASGPLGTVNVQYRGGGPPGGFPFGPGGPPGYRRPPAPVAPPPEQAPPSPTAIPPAEGTVEPKTVLVNPNVVLNPAPVEPVTRMNIVAMTPKSPDLLIYVIDASAQSGKTYRYCISYRALNPLFDKAPQRVAPAHQNWVNQFDLASPLSSFSPDITVPTQTELFSDKQQGINPRTTTPFVICTWSNGKWQKTTFMVDFGDPIGGVDSGIDYSTGCTFVDKRLGRNNQTLITLVDREGNVFTPPDTASSEYKQMSQWIEQQKAPGPAAQPPTGYPGYPGFPSGIPPGMSPPPRSSPD